MCFVSYIPLQDGYLLGSNRDENRLRKAAVAPRQVQFEDYLILMPRDGKAGGTWIATRNDGWSAVLLNGAFVPHIPAPPYRHSRGTIIPRLMENARPDQEMAAMDFKGIEPFTLLIAGNGTLKEWRWNGESVWQQELNGQQAHCRSSVTLYNPAQVQIRENSFFASLKDAAVPGRELLLNIHRMRNLGERHYDIMVERPDGIETVSTTIISHAGGLVQMDYFDYLNNFSSTLRQPVLQQLALSDL